LVRSKLIINTQLTNIVLSSSKACTPTSNIHPGIGPGPVFSALAQSHELQAALFAAQRIACFVYQMDIGAALDFALPDKNSGEVVL